MQAELYHFDSYEDIHNNHSLPRIEDFYLAGQRVSEIEKTEGQKAIIEVVRSAIFAHLKGLSVEGRTIEDHRILFHIRTLFPLYNSTIDFTFVYGSLEASATTLMHELTHSISSEWQYLDHEFVKQIASKDVKNRRDVKSGFHSYWFSKDDSSKENFQFINEAVTEKITREIIAKVRDRIQDLKPLFAGRCEKALRNFENYWETYKKHLIDITETFDRKAEAAISELEKEFQKDFEELSQSTEVSSEELEDYLDFRRRDLESSKENIISTYQAFKKPILSNGSEGKKTMEVKAIINNYSFDCTSSSYDLELKILNLILDGLAYSQSSCEEEFQAQRTKIWEDLQKAYLFGTVMWLRKIEKLFGKGILRALNEVDLITGNDQKERIAQYLEHKNDKLKRF
ncbi:MAG: hypothetical protein PHU71_02865 [Candidatus Gracilibacteria bacterium]|nr:hypothetical protein [Candidatus Gracilibacteria bacterium]